MKTIVRRGEKMKGLDGNFTNPSIDEIYESLKKKLPNTFDRETVIAGSQKRKLRSPCEISKGKVKGRWDGRVFIPDDDYVNSNYNPQKLTVAQIKEKLYSDYGIKFEGIPFTNGVADFSSVSLIDISIDEFLFKAKGITHKKFVELSFKPIQKAKLLYEVFAKNGKDQRGVNFHIADLITAERQIPIPGLPQGYAAKQLADWRGKHKFSWDEQLESGYHLVPSVIHDIASHTGVVSVSKNAIAYLRKHRQNNNGDSKLYIDYSIDECEAPINMGEYINFSSTFKRTRKKGAVKMAKSKIKTRGHQFDRHHGGDGGTDVDSGLDSGVIANNVNEYTESMQELYELGQKFEIDKANLEKEFQEIQALPLSNREKIALLQKLKYKVEKVKKEYDESVKKVHEKIQKAMEEQIRKMETAIEIWKQQADSMRNVTMEATTEDMSDVADIADERRESLEQMRQDNLKFLQEQLERMNQQSQNINGNGDVT